MFTGNMREQTLISSIERLTISFIILQFNRKPVKGIEYLISNKLVENTPISVAQFLRNTANLDKVESLI